MADRKDAPKGVLASAVRFTCSQSDLAHGIATVERAVSTRENMAILEGIYIEASGDRLRLIATDLEMSIECYVPALVEESGSAVLGARVFSQMVRKLAGEQVAYASNGARTAEIVSGRSRFTVHTMDPDDFPSLPDVDDAEMWRIKQGVLKRMIRHTAFAAASDDSRPFLTGVFIEVSGDDINFVATDSSRLAYHKGKLSRGSAQPRSGIVPVRALSELMRILGGDYDAEVEFSVTPSQAVFRADGVEMISRVIEGQFPDYRRVFPKSHAAKFRVGRSELLYAVERVSLVARRNTPIVKFGVNGETLSLSTQEAEVGQGFEELSVSHEGADMETAYQSRYLIDVLRAMDADEVDVCLGEGLKQGSVTPVGDEDYLYIVMPVRVG